VAAGPKQRRRRAEGGERALAAAYSGARSAAPVPPPSTHSAPPAGRGARWDIRNPLRSDQRAVAGAHRTRRRLQLLGPIYAMRCGCRVSTVETGGWHGGSSCVPADGRPRERGGVFAAADISERADRADGVVNSNTGCGGCTRARQASQDRLGRSVRGTADTMARATADQGGNSRGSAKLLAVAESRRSGASSEHQPTGNVPRWAPNGARRSRNARLHDGTSRPRGRLLASRAGRRVGRVSREGRLCRRRKTRVGGRDRMAVAGDGRGAGAKVTRRVGATAKSGPGAKSRDGTSACTSHAVVPVHMPTSMGRWVSVVSRGRRCHQVGCRGRPSSDPSLGGAVQQFAENEIRPKAPPSARAASTPIRERKAAGLARRSGTTSAELLGRLSTRKGRLCRPVSCSRFKRRVGCERGSDRASSR